MRKLLFLGAMLIAAPLAAQPAGPRDDRGYDAPMPEAMSDEEDWDEEDYGQDVRGGMAPPVLHPGQVEAMGGAMDRLLGAIMNLPIGGIAAAIDPYNRGRIPPGATVRDMASRDDPYFEERLRDSLQRNGADMGRAMEQIAIAAPALRRALGEVERSVERSIDESRERYERGRDPRERR